MTKFLSAAVAVFMALILLGGCLISPLRDQASEHPGVPLDT